MQASVGFTTFETRYGGCVAAVQNSKMLELFQMLHDGYDGRPLRVDGVMGPQTQWAQDVLRMPVPRRKAVYRLIRCLGLQERSGNNDHPFIDAVLARCDLGPGYAWCAAGLSWALEPVGCEPQSMALGLLDAFPRVEMPVAGDVMGFPTNDEGSGHCGGVIGVNSMFSLCVEFNSDNRVRLTRRSHDDVQYGRTFDKGRTSPGIPSYYGAPLIHPGRAGTR